MPDFPEILFEFLEWLDADQQLVRSPDESNGDERTHTEIINDFLEAP